MVKTIILMIKSFGNLSLPSWSIELIEKKKMIEKISPDKKRITTFITDNSHIEECDILVGKSSLLSQTPD